MACATHGQRSLCGPDCPGFVFPSPEAPPDATESPDAIAPSLMSDAPAELSPHAMDDGDREHIAAMLAHEIAAMREALRQTIESAIAPLHAECEALRERVARIEGMAGIAK